MSKSWSSTLGRVGKMVSDAVAPIADKALEKVDGFLDEVEGKEAPKAPRVEPTLVAKKQTKRKVLFNKEEKKIMNLSKAQVVTTGERLNLSKAFGVNFTKPVVGLEWNTKSGIVVDCDLSIVLLDADGNIIPGVKAAGQPNCLAFYGNQDLPGVHLYADNLTGDDEETDCPTGCDEQADIDFEKLDSRVAQVVIVASTHSEAENSTPENPIKGKAIPFGRAAKPRVIIFNYEGAYEPKITYELDEENSTATAVEVAKFYKRNGEWIYTSMGDEKGTDAFGLQAMLDTYKITG